MTKVAIVGSGISGLGAALQLHVDGFQTAVFEADYRLGGHAHTVEVNLDGVTCPVDTGFLVYNERTYPELIALFKRLKVPVAKSDMSFAVSKGPHRFEWCGSNLATLFAQPSNAFSPRFWSMLRDILRFNRQATELAQQLEQGHPSLDEPLDSFLRSNGYGEGFRLDYLLPMAAAIWSCPMRSMERFPIGAFVRFFNNHGLLQVNNRPQWFTVKGGSREYVRRIAAQLPRIHTSTPVLAIRRLSGRGVDITTANGTERFDAVVLACHSDQALGLLSDARPEEQALLGAVRYQGNRAYLHTDAMLMPRRKSAWAAWNYLSTGDALEPAVSVTYWLNRLQPLPVKTPVFVSLNPLEAPHQSKTLQVLEYAHPIFDLKAMQAQKTLAALQGVSSTWFAGAWTGYGFHEDGLRSGIQAAAGVRARLQALDRVAA